MVYMRVAGCKPMASRDDMVMACLEGLGIDPETMMRSSSGRRWYPKAEFIPPTRTGLVFDERTKKLFGFYEDVILVLQGGLPYAWRKTPDQPQWRGFRPSPFTAKLRASRKALCRYGRLSRRELRKLPGWKREDLAWHKYFNTFPRQVIEVLKDVNPDVSWGIFQCLCRIRFADEWFASNPAVCALAYYHFVFNPQRRTSNPFSVTRRLLRGRQRAVLERTGFDPSDRKLVRKIPPKDLSLVGLLTLRKTMKERPELRKYLRHLSGSINSNVLSALAPPARQYVTVPLLEEIASKRRKVYVTMTLRTISQMQEILRVSHRSSFKSLSKVQKVHDELVEKINRMKMEEYYSKVTFPAPPVPGVKLQTNTGVVKVEPITAPRALVAHGRKQANCVACYAPDIVRGQCFIYRVESDFSEPHTISVAKTGNDGLWRLSEIKASNNSKADVTVRQLILEWLCNSQTQSRKFPEDFLSEKNRIDTHCEIDALNWDEVTDFHRMS